MRLYLPQKKIPMFGLLGCSLIVLSGCQDSPRTTVDQQQTSALVAKKPLAELLAEKANTANKKVIQEGIEQLVNGQYEQSGEFFNRALMEDPTNTWLHYLNALRYHILARQGEVTNYDLAKAGYEQALKFDPINVMASLQLGRVYSEQKEYAKAQNEFANVLLIQPGNFDALYEMACTSYYMGDIRSAHMAIARAEKIAPNKPEVRKAAAMIFAAAGKSDQANQNIKNYYSLVQDDNRTKKLEGRVQDWRKLYQSGLVLAQADGQSLSDQRTADAAAPAETADTTATATSKAGAEGAIADLAQQSSSSSGDAAATGAEPVPGKGQMVYFDAVVMRVSDVGTTSKGQNILENFTLTLSPGNYVYARGGPRSNVSGGGPTITGMSVGGENIPTSTTSITASAVTPAGISTGSELGVTKLFTQGLSFGNVLYSLNIANVTRQHIEVVGRPSLVASIGKPAKFFSGTELVAGLSGDNGGNLVKSPIGLTLEIVPVSLKDNKIIFDVTLYGSVLSNADVANISGTRNITQQWTSVGISKISTSVEISMGETIMLGGLTERIDEKDKSGAPGLQDIPLIQYLFSNETTSSERKSVMYLITPRTYDAMKHAIMTANLDRRMTPNLTELEQKHKDWYDPDYNMVVTFRHLTPRLYREYRYGDLDPIQWDTRPFVEDSVEQIVHFMYY